MRAGRIYAINEEPTSDGGWELHALVKHTDGSTSKAALHVEGDGNVIAVPLGAEEGHGEAAENGMGC